MSNRTLYLLLVLLAAACSAATAPSPAKDSQAPAVVQLPVPPPDEAAAAAPAPDDPLPKPTPAVLWSRSEDLDGDGVAEPVRLVTFERFDATQRVDNGPDNLPIGACVNDRGDACRVILEVGAHRHGFDLEPGYFGDLAIKIIDVDRRDDRKEILLRRRPGGGEDPPYVFAVARYDGKTLAFQELWHGWGYNAGKATINGDGRLVTVYDECPDVVTVAYRLGKAGLTEESRQSVRTRQPQDCAACPVVYVKERDGMGRRGEILRDLRAPALARNQSLALGLPARFVEPRGDGSRVTLELREEKAETTYLDAVTLEVDGVHYAPLGCSGAGRHCLADGVHHVMRQGETLRLTFDTAAWRPGAAVRLWAQGYYVPAP